MEDEICIYVYSLNRLSNNERPNVEQKEMTTDTGKLGGGWNNSIMLILIGMAPSIYTSSESN